MQKFRIPYIPYRSLLLSTTVLNDYQFYQLGTTIFLNKKYFNTSSTLVICMHIYTHMVVPAISQNIAIQYNLWYPLHYVS